MQGDESSDEEMPKAPSTEPKLDYDSDEKNDDEKVPVSAEANTSELIDLGAPTDSEPVLPKKIPKLAGPK